MMVRIVLPKVVPPLDADFQPAVLVNRAFRMSVAGSGVPAAIALERDHDYVTRYDTELYPEGHPDFEKNYPYVERIVKFLLWQRGGHTLYFGGPERIAEYLRCVYSPSGARSFDYQFMSELVYERPFSIVTCAVNEVPAEHEAGMPLGRNLNGCRIGFDLGASDRKVSAVMNGVLVYSEEVIWEPRKNSDPEYHYREIIQGLQTAASKMPRVDAIGGSSAGIYINNRPLVASLFRLVPPDRRSAVRDLFLRIREVMGVPLEVINDGDVTALAGSMSINDNGILGIALGSSQAAGYVNLDGHIMGWLNELCFAPVDYNPDAAIDEWSGDRGCGSSYFSQQCVFRLAPAAGLTIPEDLTDADKLKLVQQALEDGHEGAVKIWQTMGIYLGYGIAHYLDFYALRHVLILGRCTSGIGGNLLLDGVRKVFEAEFPEYLKQVEIHLPDEKIRRVGQSVAAASLPVVPEKQ